MELIFAHYRLNLVKKTKVITSDFILFFLCSGNVRTLSALNLDGNPLKYPPFDVIKRGVKAIQNYLRQQLPSSDESPLLSDIEEQQLTPRYTPSRLMFSARKSKYFNKLNLYNEKKQCLRSSETGFYEPTQTQTQTNPLPPHLQSCIQYKRVNYSPSRPSTSIRSRPQSEMRLPQVFVQQPNRTNIIFRLFFI